MGALRRPARVWRRAKMTGGRTEVRRTRREATPPDNPLLLRLLGRLVGKLRQVVRHVAVRAGRADARQIYVHSGGVPAEPDQLAPIAIKWRSPMVSLRNL